MNENTINYYGSIEINELYYGIPFYSDSLSFQSPCNCNKDITAVQIMPHKNETKSCENTDVVKFDYPNLNLTEILISQNEKIGKVNRIGKTASKPHYVKGKKQSFVRKICLIKLFKNTLM